MIGEKLVFYFLFLLRHLRISRAPLHLSRPASFLSLSIVSDALNIFLRLTVKDQTSLQFSSFSLQWDLGRRLNPPSLKCLSKAKATPIFKQRISSKLMQSMELQPLMLPLLNLSFVRANFKVHPTFTM